MAGEWLKSELVILSAAKDLLLMDKSRSFAALRMTHHSRSVALSSSPSVTYGVPLDRQAG